MALMKRLGLVLGSMGLAISLSSGCEGSSMPSTAPGTPGTEGQACRADGTCDAPLSCYSNLCVNATGAGNGGSGGTDSSGTGGTDSSTGGTDTEGSGGADPSGEAGSDGTGAGGDTDTGAGGAGGLPELDCRAEGPYLICSNAGLDWEDSQAYCVSKGGALVKIDDSDENSDVAELISQEGSTWIGANDRDKEGEFRWTDNSPVENAHWQGGQPNDSGDGEDCAVLHAAGDWNDVDCSLTGFDGGHKMTFVCEL
jgi:hypothetical protein